MLLIEAVVLLHVFSAINLFYLISQRPWNLKMTLSLSADSHSSTFYRPRHKILIKSCHM